MGKLAGKFQGGYGKSAKNVKGYDSGYNGRGTMKFTETMDGSYNRVNKIGVGERQPMPNGRQGRVLISSANKRIGRQESTGKES